jgi:hypothetical protein
MTGVSEFPPNWETLEQSIRVDVANSIATLLASIQAIKVVTDTPNATINAAPATAIKDLARELRTVERQLIRLSRLVTAAFATGDIGV